MIIQLLICFLRFKASQTAIVCIGNDTFLDDIRCDTNIKTLSGLDTIIVSDSLVHFRDNYLVLDSHVIIQDVSNVTLKGRDDGTIIDCSDVSHPTDEGYGLTFKHVSDLLVTDLSIQNCGALHYSSGINTTGSTKPELFRSAVYTINSTNISVQFANISRNIGIGLAMFDCNGTINILNSTFSFNKVKENERDIYSGGNGVYLELTYCTPDWFSSCDSTTNLYNTDGHYIITNCTFYQNEVTRRRSNNPLAHRLPSNKHFYRGVGKGGGGVSIFIKGRARRNWFELNGCTLEENVGGELCYAGGLFMQFQDETRENFVTMEDVNFIRNTAGLEGGALNMGYILTSETLSQNHIVMKGVTFQENVAKKGGAFMLFSHPSKCNLNNTIEFEGCRWIGNRAETGAGGTISAIDYTSSSNNILPKPKFIDCEFVNNSIKGHKVAIGDSYQQISEGSGTLFVRLFTVSFGGETKFVGNKGSCVYLLDSEIEVLGKSNLLFLENKGIFGGGITLIGLSSINIAGDKVAFNFTKNIASWKGGAIYSYSIDKTSTRYFGLCFVQLQGGWNNPKFVFEGNKAITSRGNSIYVSSLLSCALLCNQSDITNLTAEESFNCIGETTFVDSNFSSEVATAGTTFHHTREPQYIIPGKPMKLPAVMKDEVGNCLSTTLLQTDLRKSTGELKLLERHTSNYNITLTGSPNDTGTIRVSTETFHNVSFKVNVTLSECPPGFVLGEDKACKCSALENDKNYNSIFACNNKQFVAVANVGYWINYIPSDDPKESSLVTGTCPLGFCYTGNNSFITLSGNPSSYELEQIICRPQNRKGILCGECIANHSVYYHSYKYACGPNTICHLGVLFYLLSEILPLTIIFSVTIVFRINFTSGYLNGFVLFAQMLDSFSLLANGGVTIEESQRQAVQAFKLIYSPFNLELFHIEPLSFCLFKGFNFLQIASMKFLTLVIALILVLLLVIIMRCSWCYKLQLACFKVRLTNSASLINGLSAFLVLSYGLCSRSCYKILNIAWLHGLGPRVVGHPRVFRMGTIEYFDKEHIPYAILALLFYVTFIVIPTAFLLLQPLSYQVLPKRLLNRNNICHKIELMKPLFDTFQGCFKDNFRFFAGLYLLYRSIASGTFALINIRFEVYIVTEIILIVMLAIHAWAQPYRKPIHNHIDTAIFLNMITINTLTIYRYYETKGQTNFNILYHVTNVQLFLGYLPVVCLVVASLVYCTWSYCLKKRFGKRKSDGLPDLILSRKTSLLDKEDKIDVYTEI